MLNLYPYLLVILISSSILVPGIVSVRRGQRSLITPINETKRDDATDLLTIDISSQEVNLFNPKASIMCVTKSSCYNVLILIQQLQYQLGCGTLQALVTRLTTHYDYHCYSSIMNLCLEFNLNSGALVSGVLYPNSKSVNLTQEAPSMLGSMLEAIGVNSDASGVTDLLTPRVPSPCACILVTLIQNIYDNCKIDNLLGINSPTLTALCQNNCCCGTGIL